VVEGFLASREEGEDLIEWRLMCVGIHRFAACMGLMRASKATYRGLAPVIFIKCSLITSASDSCVPLHQHGGKLSVPASSPNWAPGRAIDRSGRLGPE
jgi:hypothetical protein